MKIQKIILMLVMASVASVFLSACRKSTSELTKTVQESMVQKFNEKGVGSIAIRSLILTEKGGNEYSGVLETSEPNGNFTYSVIVDYDGENLTWKIQPL